MQIACYLHTPKMTASCVNCNSSFCEHFCEQLWYFQCKSLPGTDSRDTTPGAEAGTLVARASVSREVVINSRNGVKNTDNDTNTSSDCIEAPDSNRVLSKHSTHPGFHRKKLNFCCSRLSFHKQREIHKLIHTTKSYTFH